MRFKTIQLMAIGVVTMCSAFNASAETLRVGMECTYAPFNYRTADGELAGYDVDVAKGVAKIIGADFEYVCQEWDGMIPALLANKFDLIIASMSITEKRMEKIDFSGPYRFSTGQIVGSKKTKVNLFDGSGNPIAGELRWAESWSGTGNHLCELVRREFCRERTSSCMTALNHVYLDLQNGRVDLIMTNPMKAHLKFLSKARRCRL